MSEERNSNSLYIPVNIKTRFEFVSGFGCSELIITAIATAMAIMIAFIIQAYTQDIYKSVLFVLITAAATGMAIKKTEINQSITDLIMLYFRFVNTQQNYPYQYRNKYIHREDSE